MPHFFEPAKFCALMPSQLTGSFVESKFFLVSLLWFSNTFSCCHGPFMGPKYFVAGIFWIQNLLLYSLYVTQFFICWCFLWLKFFVLGSTFFSWGLFMIKLFGFSMWCERIRVKSTHKKKKINLCTCTVFFCYFMCIVCNSSVI